MTENEIANKITRISLIIVLGFSAIFFGAVHVWAYTGVRISLVFLTLLFVLVRLPGLWRSKRGAFSWIVTPVDLTALLFLSVVLIQIINLPEGIVRGLSLNTAIVSLIKQLAAANPCAARKASFSFFTTQSFPGSSSS